jgi:integrase/recombinase XerD
MTHTVIEQSTAATVAWRLVKRLMASAEVEGRQACPRGLRHAFGVGTLQAGVPIDLTQRWLGHARLCTTAIYAAACGPEEIAIAGKFWASLTSCSHSVQTKSRS